MARYTWAGDRLIELRVTGDDGSRCAAGDGRCEESFVYGPEGSPLALR